MLFADTEVFPLEWLQLGGASEGVGSVPAVTAAEQLCVPLDGSLSLDAIDRCVIQAVLAKTYYNVTAAARLLGTTRETLRYRIDKYGLRADGQSPS